MSGLTRRLVWGSLKFVIRRVIPTLVLLIAIFLGYLSKQDNPEGVFFATIFPLLKGVPPAVLFGQGRTSHLIAEVPSDIKAVPRPSGETFLTLPGSDDDDDDDSSTDGGSKGSSSSMPTNGLGMCCRPAAYDDETAYRNVLWYLVQGGRLIDTADVYLNHRAIGRAVRDAGTKYGIARSDIFITTKVWIRSYGYETTKQAVSRFLDELGLDYLDMVLIHFPSYVIPSVPLNRVAKGCAGLSTVECRADTWKALSEVRKKGLVRNVGVSNFNISQLKEIQSLNMAPIANIQFQFSPFLPHVFVELFDYCLQHGIPITAHTSLGGYMQYSKAANIDIIQLIAKKHKKTASQVLLRWALQKGAAIIPGTSNPKHMAENLDVFSFELFEMDMAQMELLRKHEQSKYFAYLPLEKS